MRRVAAGFVMIGVAAAFSACSQSPKIDPTVGGGGLTGDWRPQNGGYMATFDNGRFRTTAADTGNVISAGSYFAVSKTEVKLNWTSNITGQENEATCMRPQIDVLNCTDDGGKSFTLRRT